MNHLKYLVLVLFLVSMFCPLTAEAISFGNLVKDVGSAVKNPKEAVNPKSKGIPVSLGGGKGIFSESPIDPSSPPKTVQSFTAGDRIYGLLKADKPWKDLNKNNDYIIVWLSIDDKEKVHKSVGLKRAELLKRDYLVIDIAPDPAKSTTYADQDIMFPEQDGYKFGPELFTKYLSELSPGEHRIKLEVKAYNKVFAAGEFKISGNNYRIYEKLLVDLKKSSGQQQTMPKVGMVDKTLQKEMSQLLANAGWPKIRRLLIVDKDWWIDRVDGGDSAVKSRHIAAAAAAKDTDGSYYFRQLTFHQPKLITGAWGKLELSSSGDKKTIPEGNIDK